MCVQIVYAHMYFVGFHGLTQRLFGQQQPLSTAQRHVHLDCIDMPCIFEEMMMLQCHCIANLAELQEPPNIVTATCCK